MRERDATKPTESWPSSASNLPFLAHVSVVMARISGDHRSAISLVLRITRDVQTDREL